MTNRHDLNDLKLDMDQSMARAGWFKKNMVEPEPVEYEQDSIWEEV